MQIFRMFLAAAVPVGRQLASARRVAAAVEGGRRAADRDLRTLGIEPSAFAEVVRA